MGPSLSGGDMARMTRRQFIRLLALGAGSTAAAPLLNSCAPAAAPAETGTPTNTPFFPEGIIPSGASTAAPSDTPQPSTTPELTATPTEEPTATPAAADLAVARGGDDPEAITRRAIEAIGGIGRFVPQGATVLIKPNMCTADRSFKFAATTNPWVVGALVKLCREAGAGRVIVFDFPFSGNSAEAYEVSGIGEQVRAAGGELENVDYGKFVSTRLAGSQVLNYADLYSEVTDADVVINVPIAKNHGETGLTLGMKNFMGVIRDRGGMHSRGSLHRQIAELAGEIRPELTVVDAIRILTSGGPKGGSLNAVQQLNTVIASADFVAADAYATRLFGYAAPTRLGYVKIAAELGLGRADLDNLNIADVTA
jgi:uncharacterized protein (DUF362 family)